MQVFWVTWMAFGSGNSFLLLAVLGQERWAPCKPPSRKGPVLNAGVCLAGVCAASLSVLTAPSLFAGGFEVSLS